MAQSDEHMKTIPTENRDCPSAVPRPTSVPVVAQTKLPWVRAVLVAILLAVAAASLGLYWSSVVRGPVGISKFEDYLMERWRVPALYADALDFTNMRPSTYLILALPSAGLGVGLVLRWGRRGRNRDCPPAAEGYGK